MRMYNEDGVEVQVDKEQVDLMFEAGYTRTKPAPKEDEVEEKAEPAPKEAPKSTPKLRVPSKPKK